MENVFLMSALFLIFVSCSKRNDVLKDDISVENDSAKEIAVDENAIDESDCVFDNKPKELTQEWLKESGFNDFAWDAKNTRAIVIQEQDTLLIYKGGCNHLTSSVEIITQNLYGDIFDNRNLQKMNSIACKFKFDNYCDKIINGQFVKNDSSGYSFFLEFENDDPDSNLISEGIKITRVNGSLHILISEYYN